MAGHAALVVDKLDKAPSMNDIKEAKQLSNRRVEDEKEKA